MSDKLDEIVTGAVRRVAELPDRTSPDDWPEALLVTSEELAEIIRAALDEAGREDRTEIERLKRYADAGWAMQSATEADCQKHRGEIERLRAKAARVENALNPGWDRLLERAEFELGLRKAAIAHRRWVLAWEIVARAALNPDETLLISTPSSEEARVIQAEILRAQRIVNKALKKARKTP